MSRPTPRRSSLAGASPVTPPPTPPAAATTDATTPATSPSPKPRPKVSFYQDPNDTARVRAALFYTLHTEGPRTLTDFISHAVMTEVERLERKYNDGQPFPPIGAGELPQGRPIGR